MPISLREPFFLADIYGLEARDAQSGQVLGKVEDILTLPANNVYVIRGGERELMIPARPPSSSRRPMWRAAT